MKVIEVSNLTKIYSGFTLDNVSFDVEKGRIVGFIGRNGAGKTTTIKSMLNIIHINNGTVKYFGLDLNEHENEIKNDIGYSNGTINYYSHKKLKDIIKITKKFYTNWNDDLVQEYATLFKLDLNKTPSNLSDGMKVKFNLLLALSHNAKVLILDEPTSGLDPFSRNELLDIFISLKQKGTSILFSTHITSDLDKCADDIIYIRNGKIVCSTAKTDFVNTYSHTNETLENTILRLEKEL